MTVIAEELLARATQAPATLIFADGDDPRVLEAATAFAEAGAGRAIVLRAGPGDGPHGIETVRPDSDPRFEALASDYVRLRAARGVPAPEAREQARDGLVFGGLLVRSGAADGMVAGATRTTADVIRAAVRTVGLAPGAERVSSFFLVESADGRAITFADCGVTVRPTPDELADIAVRAAVNHRVLTGARPRVAFLSYSTLGSAESPEIEATRAALAGARERAAAAGLSAADFDGELQGDAALDEEVAALKAPSSGVAGRANVLIFPDLAAGNIAYKLVQRIGGASAFGPVLQGVARPMSDLSRGASSGEVLAVAAITALQASAAP